MMKELAKLMMFNAMTGDADAGAAADAGADSGMTLKRKETLKRLKVIATPKASSASGGPATFEFGDTPTVEDSSGSRPEASLGRSMSFSVTDLMAFEEAEDEAGYDTEIFGYLQEMTGDVMMGAMAVGGAAGLEAARMSSAMGGSMMAGGGGGGSSSSSSSSSGGGGGGGGGTSTGGGGAGGMGASPYGHASTPSMSGLMHTLWAQDDVFAAAPGVAGMGLYDAIPGVDAPDSGGAVAGVHVYLHSYIYLYIYIYTYLSTHYYPRHGRGRQWHWQSK